MSDAFRSVLIVTRAGDPGAGDLAGSIGGFLSGRGIACEVCEHRTDVDGGQAGQPGHDFDLVLVLGGDGTFISVARNMYGSSAPLLGLDLGQVGFLAELAQDDWQAGLSRVLAGQVPVSRRMSLSFDIEREGRVVRRGFAVNDIVVSRVVLARLIRLHLSYGEEAISTLRADGVIVATPTGSTAYGVSAGGPIVHPGMQAFCVTPICPFLNGFRPLVLPAGREFRIAVEEARGEVNLTEDGQRAFELSRGDVVVVRRAEKDLLLVGGGDRAYFAKLRGKGFLRENET
jgi:NAD+ kinase